MGARRFSEELARLRVRSGLSLRSMARQLDISASYYNDIEKGRRNPPGREKIDRFASVAGLTKGERELLLDLAGEAWGRLPADIEDYVMERDYVRQALRAARDADAGRVEWITFARSLRRGEDS